MKRIETGRLDIDLSGQSDITSILQELIDRAASEKKTLIFSKGIYLTNPLFFHSNMKIYFEEGAIIKSLHKEDSIASIQTRVAGIDISWYPAVLNIIGKRNVQISGHGIIDGDGAYFWEKYWGVDMKGGMRKEYDSKGLRFLCDYDCKRLRNILIQESENIKIDGVEFIDSGFWNIHLLYSKNVTLKNVIVNSDKPNSPSTDGIDIDSCDGVIIDGAILNTNDDSIAIKSGRDQDGINRAICAKNVIIKNCKILKGFGITIGSELSGGIENISINNISFYDTDCGFRIKSSEARGGHVRGIRFSNVKMYNVKYIFNINLNWNQSYNYINCNNSLDNEAYNKLILPILKPSKTKIEDLRFKNIQFDYSNDYVGISRIFHIIGYKDEPIRKLSFCNIKGNADELGIIEYVTNINMKSCDISAYGALNEANNEYDNR